MKIGESLTTKDYMRYLGLLGLLSECSVQVDEETRELIEDAFTDAETALAGAIKWRRTLNLIEINVMPAREAGEGVER